MRVTAIYGGLGLAGCLAALMLMAGCNAAGSHDRGSNQITEHRFAETSAATLELGEDASVGGAASCKGHMVVHAGPNPLTAPFICTVSCKSQGDCPEQGNPTDAWRCVQVYPAADGSGSMCVPPKTWTPHATTAASATTGVQP